MGVREEHACAALFPSPGYQLRHGARSKLIGCLSCWGWGDAGF